MADLRKGMVDKLHITGDMCPSILLELVKQGIMKYHRLANDEIIPKQCLHVEIRRFRIDSTSLN